MIDLTKRERHRFKLSFVGVNMPLWVPLWYKYDYQLARELTVSQFSFHGISIWHFLCT